MCLLFILIFQSISCRNIMLSSCSPVQIYIYYYYSKELQLFQKMFYVKCCSTYAYNWVHFWFLQFPEQLPYPVLHIYFQHYPWCFYYFQSVLISYWVHLFDIIFCLMPYVCIFFTNQLQYVTLVHIQWCMVYVIYIAYIYIYIYEIYTLVWTVTDSYTLQSATIVIPKTILQCITDICHEISAYHRYSVI